MFLTVFSFFLNLIGNATAMEAARAMRDVNIFVVDVVISQRLKRYSKDANANTTVTMLNANYAKRLSLIMNAIKI